MGVGDVSPFHTKYRIVPDYGQSNMFGVDVQIDEAAFLRALERYVSSLKDKYRPQRRISCRLIVDESSFELGEE